MGDACAFIDGVSVIDKARRQSAQGLTEDLLGCKQCIQRVARAKGPGMCLTRCHRRVWVARCSALAMYLDPKMAAFGKRIERSSARYRAPSACDSNRDVRWANDDDRAGQTLPTAVIALDEEDRW